MRKKTGKKTAAKPKPNAAAKPKVAAKKKAAAKKVAAAKKTATAKNVSPAKKTATAEVDPRFAAIMQSFAKTKDVTSGRMMASFGLKVRGKIFAMFVRGEFVAKLPKARVDALAEAGKGTNFDPGGRGPMKEWIAIPGDESIWLALAKEAHRFVSAGA